MLASVGIYVLRPWIKHGVNASYIRHALQYGGGLVPHIYGGLLITATDRMFITTLLGVHETGLYAVGAQVGMIIAVLEHSFNLAWTPWLFEKLKRNTPQDRRLIKTITRAYNVTILILAAGLSMLAPWFLNSFVGKEFVGAARFVFWLALANALGGMYKMVANQIFFANKTQILAWITLGAGITNVVFNYVLISLNGSVGAAQATALTYFLYYVATAYFSARVMATLCRENPTKSPSIL